MTPREEIENVIDYCSTNAFECLKEIKFSIKDLRCIKCLKKEDRLSMLEEYENLTRLFNDEINELYYLIQLEKK